MRRYLFIGSGFVLLGFLAVLPARPPGPQPTGGLQPADTDNADSPQLLAYGQLHEAYAQPTDGAPKAGITVNKQPPDPVPEIPPEQKPDGDDVQWFPGYWSWDQDKTDFVWISGVYRKVPAGQQFVPGYWTQEGENWTWVPGFWTAAQREDLTYVPEPPASLDNGPNLPPPEEKSVYSPGYWYFATTGWFWHPGSWVVIQPGLVWIAPHYCWTPSGCLLVGGYWDYPLEERGLVFAPVYFPRRAWVNNPNWVYYPRTVVGVDFVLESLFVTPHRHFCYGNYYGPKWQERGYVAWVNYAPKARDTVYAYYAQRSPKLVTSLQTVYKERVAGTLTPPAKIINQQSFVTKEVNITNNTTTVVNNKTIQNVNVKGPLQVISTKNVKQTNITQVAALPRLTTVSATQVQKQTQHVQSMHAAVKNRKEIETKLFKDGGAPAGKSGKVAAVSLQHFKLPATVATKVSTKVNTPALPGINTAAKPKPGVQPVVHPPHKDGRPDGGKNVGPTGRPVPKGEPQPRPQSEHPPQPAPAYASPHPKDALPKTAPAVPHPVPQTHPPKAAAPTPAAQHHPKAPAPPHPMPAPPEKKHPPEHKKMVRLAPIHAPSWEVSNLHAAEQIWAAHPQQAASRRV